ncbi:melatonin receptor type 1B-B-like [Lineus longissimus]|uniref:melatonin receptor type 1B-B-like n=1 Tax=Lineus longissimus TaxID=88925 RepID=UPI00315DE2EE
MGKVRRLSKRATPKLDRMLAGAFEGQIQLLGSMDIPYYAPNQLPNDSKIITRDFLQNNLVTSIPYLVVIVLATLLGTIGNILVIGAVLSNKVLRTEGNCFILNLAIADISVSCFVDPMSIVGVIKGEAFFHYQPILCELIASVCLTACFCSLLSIGAISLNRYIHICHHNNYAAIYTKRNTILMCLGLWVLSFMLEMPNFFGWGDHVYDQKTLNCVWDRSADFSYTMFFSCAGVLFPLVIISVCYYKIYACVVRSKSRVAAASAAAASQVKNDFDRTKDKRESIRLSRTLFVIFVVFAVCWSPYAIIVAADINDAWPREVHLYSILLAHSNSSLNSLVYGITNRQFRRGYRKFLRMDRWNMSNTISLTETRGNTFDNNETAL